MAGIFGVVSKEDCVKDLFYGTFYLQHRAQDYCGLALKDEKGLHDYSHRGLIKQQFPKERLQQMNGSYGIGCVSSERQPISILSKLGGMILGFDGNIINYEELKDRLLNEGAVFSGYRCPEEVRDCTTIAKIISKEAIGFIKTNLFMECWGLK